MKPRRVDLMVMEPIDWRGNSPKQAPRPVYEWELNEMGYFKDDRPSDAVIDTLADVVDSIIEQADVDVEAAGVREADLYWTQLSLYAPPDVWAELKRLHEASFPRYAA